MAQEEQVKDVNNEAAESDANQEVNNENKTFSSVSIASTQKKFLLVFFIILAIGIVYYFVFEGDSSKDKNKPEPVDKKEKEQILKKSKPVPEVSKDSEVKDTIKDSKPIEAPQVQAPTPPLLHLLNQNQNKNQSHKSLKNLLYHYLQVYLIVVIAMMIHHQKQYLNLHFQMIVKSKRKSKWPYKQK